METVSRLITQYLAVEQMYGMDATKFAASLRQSLISLYKSILQYLMYHIGLLDQNGFKRFFKRLQPNALEEINVLLGKVEDNKSRVDSDAAHVSNENTKRGIDILQEGQKYLITQQQRLIDSQQDLAESQVVIKSQQNILQQQAVERMNYIQRILEEWQDDVQGVQGQVAEMYASTIENANLKRISDWLSIIRQDLHHAAAQRDVLRSSGKWLLNSPDFRDWKESPQSSALWIHGYLGTGKTKLVSILIETLKTWSEDPFEAGHLAYFYCSRNEAGTDNNTTASLRGEPVEILRNLVKQLAKARGGGGLDAVVTQKYSQLKGRDMEEPRRLSMRECVEMIILLSRDSPTTIVVDGLDECKHVAVPELIQSFEEIMRRSSRQVKVFFSTRYVSFVVDCLKQYGYPALEISADKNSGDIAKFIDVELERRIKDKSLLHGDVSANLRQEIQETLSHRAGSMFWYASLQLNLLCDRTAEQDETAIRQKLRKSPTTLDGVYAQIIQDIEDPKNSQKSRFVAKNAMKWLLCAQEPLSCSTFLEAVSDELVDRDLVIRVCRTLVVEDKVNDVFEFAHLSIREYLERTQDYRPCMQHLSAAERCIKMLETSFLSSAMNQEITPSQEKFRRYAFLFWPSHYQQIQFDEIDERKEKLRNKLKGLLIRSSGVSPTFKQWISQVKGMEQELGEAKSLSTRLKSLQASPDTPLFTACVFGFADLIKQFRRSKGFDLGQCNIQHQTALCLAVENNQLETVENLLVDLPKPYLPPQDANQVNYWALVQFEEIQPDSPPSVIIYATALQAAAANGLEAVARYLLEPQHNTNVDVMAGYYGNALQAAALKGYDNLLQMLLDDYKAEPNSQGGFHGNALQAAAISGNERSVALLIDHGAIVSAPGGHYGSALMAAVVSGSKDVLELLLEQKPDINIRSRLYGTPLQKAADMDSKLILERLIAEGAEINAHENSANSHTHPAVSSALAAAAWGGHSKVVSILLENGAQADTERRGDAFHILHQAASKGMVDLMKYCLDQRGCDIDMTTNEGQEYSTNQVLMSPLSFACAEGHFDAVAFLLERGASIEFEGDALTTLWLAARGGHSQIIKKLVEDFRARKGPNETQRFIDRVDPVSGGSALYEATRSGSLEAIDMILELRARYSCNSFLMNPLHIAAAHNRPDIIRLFVQAYQQGKIFGDFSADARDKNGKTPLAYSIEHDSIPVATMLLKIGADPGVSDNAQNSALHYAVERDQLEIVRTIISGHHRDSFLDQRNSRRNTALNEAFEKRHYEAIKLLLTYGAKWHDDEGRETNLHRAARGNEPLVQEYITAFKDSDQLTPFLNSRNMYKGTPLHSAAEFNQPNILRILLESGADIMAVENTGRTALFWAAERDHIDCVRVLLETARKNVADVQRYIDHRNIWNRPALHEAVLKRHSGSVQMLLDYGADFISPGPDNETALILAAKDLHKLGYDGSTSVTGFILEKAKNTKRLSEVINARNTKNESTLWHASHNNIPDMVSLLLSQGADYSISNRDNVTPLHIACWMNYYKVVEILLEHSIQDKDQARFRSVLNQRDIWGRTGLNAAACQGNSDIVALLLEEYNADYTIACPGGDVPEPWYTPLHYAASRGKERVAEILLRYISSDSDQAKARTFIDAKFGQDRRLTALMDAALKGRARVVEMLLKAGADYSLRDDYKATALILGACSGDVSTVRALLAHLTTELDILKVKDFLNAKNNLGKTALMDGAERDFSPIVKALMETPHLDYTLQDNHGFTALHWSALKNSQSATAVLLEFASQDKTDTGRSFQDFLNMRTRSNGHSALFSAAVNGHFELTKMILEDYNAMYDTYDNRGCSPLHIASLRKHLPVAEMYLAKAYADKARDGSRFDAFLNKRNDEGKSALELAVEGSDGRFMELLKKYGAK